MKFYASKWGKKTSPSLGGGKSMSIGRSSSLPCDERQRRRLFRIGRAVFSSSLTGERMRLPGWLN